MLNNHELFKKAFKAGFKAAKKKLNESVSSDSKTKYEKLKKLVRTIRPTVSAWSKGVADYAEWIVENLEENLGDELFAIEVKSPEGWKELEETLLGGASSWKEASYGGNYLIWDKDIAEALCSPSELKKTKGGTRKPNAREEWLDVQARALYQAADRVKLALEKLL